MAEDLGRPRLPPAPPPDVDKRLTLRQTHDRLKDWLSIVFICFFHISFWFLDLEPDLLFGFFIQGDELKRYKGAAYINDRLTCQYPRSAPGCSPHTLSSLFTNCNGQCIYRSYPCNPSFQRRSYIRAVRGKIYKYTLY
jgi:hypothetical protein